MSHARIICIVFGALAAAAEAASLHAAKAAKPPPRRGTAAAASTVVLATAPAATAAAPVFLGCYQGAREAFPAAEVTTVGDCLAAARGSRYVAFDCPRPGASWTCRYGDSILTQHPLDRGYCSGRYANHECNGFPSAGTYTTEYNGESLLLGGRSHQAVYELVTTTNNNTTAPPVTASGDARLVNARGEQFGVNRPGRHALLVIPRGGSSESAQLHVEAQVTPRGQPCGGGGMHMTGLTVAGAWLGALGPMRLTTSGEGFLTPGVLGIEVAGSANLTVQEFTGLVPRAVATLSALQPEEELSRLNQHVATHAARLSLGPTTLKITWVHQKEKVGFSNSLDMLIAGLGKVDAEIGGLLGEDSHVPAEGKPERCRGRRLAAPAAGEEQGTSFRLALASLKKEEKDDEERRQALLLFLFLFLFLLLLLLIFLYLVLVLVGRGSAS